MTQQLAGRQDGDVICLPRHGVNIHTPQRNPHVLVCEEGYSLRKSPEVDPQLTVVITNTISQSGVAAHPNGAHVAWVVSNAAVAQETTAVPGRSNSGR